MVDSQRRLPDSQHNPPFQPQKYQDFYSWLRTIPLGVLHDLYTKYDTRRNSRMSLNIKEKATIFKDKSLPQQPLAGRIALRKSVFILIFNLIFIELFFDILYFGLKLPTVYFQIPQSLDQILMPIYFSVFIAFNILKFLLIIIVASKWITNSYVIANGEIRYRTGFFSHNEKIYLCTHAQEVTFSQGIMGKLCNYGSVEIYNPVVAEKIYLDSIPNPRKYVEIIKNNITDSSQNDFIVMQPQSEEI